MVDSYVVTYRHIPWEPASAENVYPLGRNVKHDSRNRAYPYQRTMPKMALTSQMWPRHIPILDQGAIGSCTGEEAVGALGTGSLWDALSPDQQGTITQALAYKIYSQAETIDGDGPYPPQDNGSSGPSAAQAAKSDGYISGYTHGFGLADVLDALESGPVGIGSNWYDSMDRPDNGGFVTITPGASIRGGHEYLCRGKDITTQTLHFDNSWGTGYGLDGSFSYSYATLERLLSEQGDCTVAIPLTAPAPVPVPVPTPTPVNPPDAADKILAPVAAIWSHRRHITTADRNMASTLIAWLAKKGY